MDYKIKRLCPVCGRVHTGHCKAVYAEKQRNSQADKFRNTQLWKRTARAILERDFHCCRVCLEQGRLVNRGLSVHHITPLAEDFSLRLDESNLITLCRVCHDQLEAGPFSLRGAQLRECFTREKLRELTARKPLAGENVFTDETKGENGERENREQFSLSRCPPYPREAFPKAN